ncbi:MAG: hypothetical protein OXE03_12365, partial [Gammaproteobacteria bacterium]|nr:hypothetical protein [Gammaproteobacteria bacterium]
EVPKSDYSPLRGGTACFFMEKCEFSHKTAKVLLCGMDQRDPATAVLFQVDDNGEAKLGPDACRRL